MRKFVFIIILSLSLQGKAQMWFANGAEWHYYVNQFYAGATGLNGNGHYKITVTNSLTIAGDTCYELTRRFTGIPFSPLTPPVNDLYKGHFIVKVKNRVLSLCTNSTTPSFDTICDFNAVVGSKWKALINSSCSVSNATTAVTSVSTITINNVSLKQVGVTNTYLAIIGSNTYTLSNTDLFVEKLGGLNSFYYYNCCSIDCDVRYGDLSCYKDDNFPLYKVPGYTLACNYSPVSIKENSYQTVDVSIYPQPANQIVNLSSPLFANKRAQIQISNNLGQLCFKQSVQFNNGNAQLPLANLPKGIYFLKLIDEDFKTFTNKVIID
jgi:hypothetical protein